MKQRAFTYVEALVVFAIIAIILGIAFPAWHAARNRSNTSGVSSSKIKTPYGTPDLWKVTVDGHDYLGFGHSGHGGALVHSESCQCKKL